MSDQNDLNFNIPIGSNKSKENVSSQQVKQEPESIQVNENNPNQPKKEELAIVTLYKKAANPGVCLVTVLFKIAAILSFILLDLFTNSEAIVYLAVIIIGSADFWVMKNLSGRILVGLRWWNEVKENGEEVWIFEKLEHSVDKSVFWISLYANVIAWLVLFIWEMIRLKFIWAIIAFICLVFAGTNFYGYFKCSKTQQDNIMKFGAKAVLKVASKGVDSDKK